MANLIVPNLGTIEYGGTPYGNSMNRHFVFQTTAAGGIYGAAPATAAVGATDTVVLGVLRKGMRMDDALIIISDAFSATITGKLGFLYSDGVEDTQAVADKEGRTLVLQDDDYFLLAGFSAAAQARQRANNLTVFPVTLPKDANLVWTNAVAAHASVGRMDVLVYGEDRGPL